MNRRSSFLWLKGVNRLKVGILAVQGAFIEHEHKMEALGATCVEIRKKEDLNQHFDGLILPGGESTVQGKLLNDLDMFADLKKRNQQGIPTLATCAGLILLAEHISNDDKAYFQTLPVTVKRNAYGRQLGSFYTEEEVKGIGQVPMTFIRAPYVESAEDEVEVLAKVEEKIVAVRYGSQIGLSFHPELDENNKIHEMFYQMMEAA